MAEFMKTLKKILKYTGISFLIAILFWIGISFFLASGFKVLELEDVSIPADYYEARGAMHIHSTHSGGSLEPAEIRELAGELGLDFIVLSDWGIEVDFEAAHPFLSERPVVVTATERSTDDGHMLGYGLKDDIEEVTEDSLKTLRLIENAGGLPVAAHPFRKRKNPWTNWDLEGLRGLEVLNLSEVALNVPRSKAILMIPQALFNTRSTLCKLIEYPAKAAERWGQMNKTGVFYAFAGVDAQGEKFLNFPSYESLMPILNTHLILNKAEAESFNADIVNACIREGRFYISVDGLAVSRYFNFKARGKSGEVYQMGSVPGFEEGMEYQLKYAAPEGAYVKIYQDGELVATSAERKLTGVIRQPGVLRVEIWISADSGNYSEDKIWIISNPIFIRENGKTVDGEK